MTRAPSPYRELAFYQALSARSFTAKVAELYEAGSREEARQIVLAACDDAERSCRRPDDLEEKVEGIRQWYGLLQDIEDYLSGREDQCGQDLCFRLRGLINRKSTKAEGSGR